MISVLWNLDWRGALFLQLCPKCQGSPFKSKAPQKRGIWKMSTKTSKRGGVGSEKRIEKDSEVRIEFQRNVISLALEVKSFPSKHYFAQGRRAFFTAASLCGKGVLT